MIVKVSAYMSARKRSKGN